MLIETKKWKFPFLPQVPAGLGCWERHTAPLCFQMWLGKSTEKTLPVSRRRYSSNHGRDLWTFWRTFWRGLRQGGGVTSYLCPIFLAFLLPSPCPVPSPALSLVRRLRQRLALFIQKVWERRKGWIPLNALHTPQTSGIFPAHPPTVSWNQQQCCFWHWKHRDQKDLSACLGQTHTVKESFKKFNSLPSCFPKLVRIFSKFSFFPPRV